MLSYCYIIDNIKFILVAALSLPNAMNTIEISEKSALLKRNIGAFIAKFSKKCGFCTNSYGFVAISAPQFQPRAEVNDDKVGISDCWFC